MASKAVVLDANILIRAVLGQRVRRILFPSSDMGLAPETKSPVAYGSVKTLKGRRLPYGRGSVTSFRAATVSTYIVGFLLFLAGYFWATSVSPNVDRPSERIFERSNFWPNHRSPTLAVRNEKIGSQAKAPAPLDRMSLCVNVGQALSPADSALMPIFSQALRESVLSFFVWLAASIRRRGS
jgi:hypothetical protein